MAASACHLSYCVLRLLGPCCVVLSVGAIPPPKRQRLSPAAHSLSFSASSWSVRSSDEDSPAAAMATAAEVDDSLYSRQLYVLGVEAQRRLQAARVLIAGLDGLGVEVAKNVTLAGVQCVDLLDDRVCSERDRGSQFAISASHVQHSTSRAAASLPFLRDLNPYVQVNVVSGSDVLQAVQRGAYCAVLMCGLPLADQLAVDAECHSRSIPFLSASALGLFGSIFVDVGRSFVVSDATGEPPVRGLVSHISNAVDGVVTVHEESRHGLSDGDLVTFEEVEGMSAINNQPPRAVHVLSPFTFSIGDTSALPAYTGNGGYFQQVKQPTTITMRTLEQQLNKPTLLTEFTCERELHVLYLALEEWRQQHGRGLLPSPTQPSHTEQVMDIAQSIGARLTPPLPALSPSSTAVLRRLARISSCSLSPVCSYLGGVAGQELLKAVTGKFNPLQQLYYFDASHVLPPEQQPDSELAMEADSSLATTDSRYHDQLSVFGSSFQSRLQGSHVFVIGAGAIGCELLKSLSLLGMGRVTVTDMDSIERSNLNRQFLFRSADVGQLKATVAAREAVRLNSECVVDAHSLRVGQSTEDVYDDAFWESLDAAVTALDNVDARLYLDQRCLYYQKPMFDSGTLGSKGSVQTVIPHLTESYGASRDPPEESIPICTLKSFPNKIEHCIQYARDSFEGVFANSVQEANRFIQQGDAYIAELASKPHEQLTVLQSVHLLLVAERPTDFADCVRWARAQFEVEFNHRIRQLLHVFPPDATTAEGVAFWSATKRQPTPLNFDAKDPTHIAFILAAATLRAANFGLTAPQQPADTQQLTDIATKTALPALQLSATKIATTDAELKAMEEKSRESGGDDEDDLRQRQLAQLESGLRSFRSSHPTLTALHPIEFDKDESSQLHVSFVAHFANLRARNYRIKEVSVHEAKLIAGKIIPAIATTTALVTGLVCLELIKYIQGRRQLADYRNSTVNLALPLLLTNAEPMPAPAATAHFPTGEWRWSQWDRIELGGGRDLTLSELIDYFHERWRVELSMLSYGAAMLYYSFGNARRMAERKAMRISQLVSSVTGKQFAAKDKYLLLEACVNNEEGDEIDIPFIRFQFKP